MKLDLTYTYLIFGAEQTWNNNPSSRTAPSTRFWVHLGKKWCISTFNVKMVENEPNFDSYHSNYGP